jgi:hypothetical protein
MKTFGNYILVLFTKILKVYDATTFNELPAEYQVEHPAVSCAVSLHSIAIG